LYKTKSLIFLVTSLLNREDKSDVALLEGKLRAWNFEIGCDDLVDSANRSAG
jgi:hypothetical protein